MADINKNLSCAFSNDLVSYLYGEMDPAGTGKLEAHLSDCTRCTDEFAGLSLARLGVYEWHRDEFRHLVTPLIEIPYRSAIAHDSAHSSWIDALRGVFAPAPRWATIGGAFAMLAIALGITLIASNIFRKGSDLAKKNTIASTSNVTKPTTSPAAPKIEQEVAVRDNSIMEKSDGASVASDAKNNKPGFNPRASNFTAARNKPKTSSQRSMKELQAAKRDYVNRNPPRPSPPQLSDFRDEEDNTLRLADLFADVDTGR